MSNWPTGYYGGYYYAPYESYVDHICNKCKTEFVIKMATIMKEDRLGKKIAIGYKYIAGGQKYVCPVCGESGDDIKMID